MLISEQLDPLEEEKAVSLCVEGRRKNDREIRRGELRLRVERNISNKWRNNSCTTMNNKNEKLLEAYTFVQKNPRKMQFQTDSLALKRCIICFIGNSVVIFS